MPVSGKNGLIRKPANNIETCTIITTEANEVLEPVHDRISFILQAKDYDQWLDAKEKDTDKLQKLLASYPAKEITSQAFRPFVNSPSVDSPQIINNCKSKTVDAEIF